MTREEAIQEFQNVKDLIRQDGKDWFDERDLEIIDMAIEALQTELVRCKDCKHRETDDCPMYRIEWFSIDEGYGDFEDDYIIHDYTTDNGYCHYGERK